MSDGVQTRTYDAPPDSTVDAEPVRLPEGRVKLAGGYLWVAGDDGFDSMRIAVPAGAVVEPHGDQVRLRYVEADQEVQQLWSCATGP